MALKEQLTNDLKAAMLSGDRFVADTVRNLKAAILNEEVAAGKREQGLDDAEIEKIIAREIKKRRESATMYRDNGREELAEPEEQEMAILQNYLPEQMSEAELRTLIDTTIADLGVNGPQAMGQVIGAVKAQAGTAADGATVARLVKDALS